MPTWRTTRREAMRGLFALASASIVAVWTGGAGALPRTPPKGAPDASLQLVVLYGTKTDGGVTIPPGYDDLKNPPWNAYNNYAILRTKTIAFTKGTSVKEELEDGSTLETTLKEMPTAKDPKFYFDAVLTTGKGKKAFSLSWNGAKGARFFPTQVPYKDGGIVLSLKIL